MDFTTLIVALIGLLAFFVIYYTIPLSWRLVRNLRVRGWNKARELAVFEIEFPKDGRCSFFGNVTTYVNYNPAFPARVMVSSQVAVQEFLEAVKQMVRA